MKSASKVRQVTHHSAGVCHTLGAQNMDPNDQNDPKRPGSQHRDPLDSSIMSTQWVAPMHIWRF